MHLHANTKVTEDEEKKAFKSVMKKFEETGSWNLPVCDNGTYVGFVSKSKLFSAYRKILLEQSEH